MAVIDDGQQAGAVDFQSPVFRGDNQVAAMDLDAVDDVISDAVEIVGDRVVDVGSPKGGNNHLFVGCKGDGGDEILGQ